LSAAPVAHLHSDPPEPSGIEQNPATRSWDLAICNSERLRAGGDARGRNGTPVGITGQAAYAGTLAPTADGRVPLPLPEWAERLRDAADYTNKVAGGWLNLRG
jgi:hypothetical protein